MGVVIVGAGLAGLAATHTLRRNGVDVTTFESRNTAGGRVSCYYKEGYCFDLGAQFAVRRWTHTLNLCNELGLGSEIKTIAFQGAIYRDGNAHSLHALGGLAYQLKSIPYDLKFRGLPSGTYSQLAKLAFAIAKRLRGLDYKNYDFTPLLELQGTTAEEFSLEHGGKEVLDYVIHTAVGTLILSEPDEISISLLISLIGAASGVRILERGMGSLTAAAYDNHKESIKLSTPVRKIVVENKQVKGVKTDDGFFEADHVICATTAGVALKLVPDLPAVISRPLETVRYSSTSHFMFALEQAVLPEDWYVIALPQTTGSFLPSIFDFSRKSVHFAPEGAGLVHCMSLGRYDAELSKLPHRELRRHMIAEIQKYVPDMPDNPYMTEFIKWNEAVCLQAPGQFAAIHEMNRSNLSDIKGLHLAGSYLKLPSSMESAVRSGEEAANAVLGT